jgi:hypothetical protein
MARGLSWKPGGCSILRTHAHTHTHTRTHAHTHAHSHTHTFPDSDPSAQHQSHVAMSLQWGPRWPSPFESVAVPARMRSKPAPSASPTAVGTRLPSLPPSELQTGPCARSPGAAGSAGEGRRGAPCPGLGPWACHQPSFATSFPFSRCEAPACREPVQCWPRGHPACAHVCCDWELHVQTPLLTLACSVTWWPRRTPWGPPSSWR